MSIIRTATSLSFLCLAAALAACSANTSDEPVAGSQANLNACDANGTWAIKVETPVQWAGSFVVQGGTGTITNWLKSNRTQDGTSVTDEATLCGVHTPDYLSAPAFGGEKYGVAFPDELWESGVLPTVTINGTLSGTEVGSSFQAEQAAAVLGATMANPATDPWPANAALLQTLDVDNDGKPGVSVDTASGAEYKNPPLDAFLSARASKVYTAFRQVITTQGSITSCNRVDGSGTVAVIANKPAIDQRVLGCQRENGTECSASEYKLLDSAAPVYKPTGDAIVTMVRIPAEASCADIRAIDFETATGNL
ncbi:MAG: hypothetical protein KIT84_14715 [Labilithrix sp.]|nr:hypothetical protein [Labilithrix sp.]MCW5812274.1 hypothetical protein [Labilithrix sp.]